MKLLKPAFIIAIVAVAMIGVMVPSVFATHDEDVDYSNDPEYDGKEPFTFYQIFVSKDNAFSDNCEEAKNSMLRSKSIQILKLYGYTILESKLDCVNVDRDSKITKYDYHSNPYFGLPIENVIQKAKNWHEFDLLIIFLDRELSSEFKNESTKTVDGISTSTAGHFRYMDKTLMSLTYHDDVVDDISTIQILAHEIAHFALYEKYEKQLAFGTNDKIFAIAVEEVDDLFDDCFDQKRLNTCTEYWVPLSTHYGYTIEVMSPDYVMKVAESMVAPKYTPSAQKESVQIIWSDQPTNYQIGKQTLIEGKLIDSRNYPISGKIISIKDYNFGELVRTVTDEQGMFRYIWTPTSENHAIHAGFQGSDTMIQTGSMLTTNLIIEKQTIAPRIESKNNANVDFKLWGGSEERLKYEGVWVGGSLNSRSANPNLVNLDLYVQNNGEWQFVKSKRVGFNFSASEFNTNFGYAGLFENGSYKVVASYYSKIAEQELTDIRYFKINSSSKLSPTLLSEPITWQEELKLINHYQNVINSFQSQSAKDLVTLSFIDGDPFSAKNMLKNYKKHNEVLGGWQIHLSYVDIVIEQAKIAEKQYQDQQKSKITHLETKEQLEELFFQQYTLLDTIKSNFQKLDNEQILLKQKLENLPSISNPDYVDNGWDILKENQVKIDQLESLINGAKRELDAGRNESAEKYLESIEIKQHIIEKNLKLIQININNVEGGVPSEDSADGIYKSTEEEGGGCLIATATYGSEMAPQVQQLRELRDNQLLQTESGTQFMGMFNDVYYSFSPIIADYERENPYFKEMVKLAITPMISTLSLMENAESESEVLGIGISVIMLNLGMYLGVPAIVVVGIRKRF